MMSTSVAVLAAVKLPELNGFRPNQRVVAQDVEASPPQLHRGTIVSIWSDETATVNWDYNLPFEAERHLVESGHVRLHHLQRLS